MILFLIKFFSKLNWKFKMISCRVYIKLRTSLNTISIGEGCKFIGIPILNIIDGARLNVGNNCTFSSDKVGYHLGMNGSVKLVASEPSAIITIGNNTRVNGSCIHARKEVRIGNNCLVAANCNITDSNGHEISMCEPLNRINTRDKPRNVIIEDGVWIGINCVVLPGVTIGEGAIISANSVVKNDIPRYAIAAGNPAIVIKKYTDTRLGDDLFNEMK